MKLTPPPSAITHQHHLPQSRAAVPVPPSEIPPSSVRGTHRSTEHQHQTSHRRKLHPLVQEPKKIKQQHTSDILFISDSIFKFLEDKVSLQYILQNDYEWNISLFHRTGSTSTPTQHLFRSQGYLLAAVWGKRV